MTIENTNLFEIENARSMDIEQIALTFVPTQAFWRMLSRKHNVILGSRGSGKTALARMLSHNCLKKLNDAKAKEYIQDKSFIGLYVPTRLDWISALRNKPWKNSAEKELFFQWFLNISICQAFLESTKSCIDSYSSDKGAAARVEAEIVEALAKVWLARELPPEKLTITSIQSIIREIQYCRQKEYQAQLMEGLTGRKVSAITSGSEFDVELFSPLYIGKEIVSNFLNIPNSSTWLVAIDEAELLDKDQQRILNSHMRAYSENVFIKMTTTPYGHYTTETTSGAMLDPGEDFEYVYIDQDPVTYSDHGNDNDTNQSGELSFAKMIFKKRAQFSGGRYAQLSYHNLFGDSQLLGSTQDDWSKGSELRQALLSEANTSLIYRAQEFFTKIDKGCEEDEIKRFNDSVGRKVGGRLALRMKLKNIKGNGKTDAYSGFSMIERCCDGNPRRLVRIINAMLKTSSNWRKRGNSPRIRLSEQSSILAEFGKAQLDRALPEPDGPELHQLITDAGIFFSKQLLNEPLMVDDYCSIKFTKDSFDHYRKVIERGCELGLLFPFKKVTGALPYDEGEFRLAFVLAAHFKVFPRKGKSIDIRKIPRTPDQMRIDFEC